MSGDRHPGFSLQAELENGIWSDRCPPGEVKNNRDFFIGDMLFLDDQDLLFRHLEMLADGKIKSLNPSSAAAHAGGPISAGGATGGEESKEQRERDQRNNGLLHNSPGEKLE
ncbi:MAG: hypothetical protein HY717_17055 [Planctomycetes bacterium]|nr:hypothetical protein [Planctomycetota bacterium]